jgi:hypothetical protein
MHSKNTCSVSSGLFAFGNYLNDFSLLLRPELRTTPSNPPLFARTLKAGFGEGSQQSAVIVFDSCAPPKNPLWMRSPALCLDVTCQVRLGPFLYPQRIAAVSIPLLAILVPYVDQRQG